MLAVMLQMNRDMALLAKSLYGDEAPDPGAEGLAALSAWGHWFKQKADANEKAIRQIAEGLMPGEKIDG